MIFSTGIAILTLATGVASNDANPTLTEIWNEKVVYDLLATISPELSPDYPQHKVQKNENDWTIAKKYDITVNQLHSVNPGITWTKLQIGQKLNLPNGTEPIGYVPSIRTSRARIAKDNVRIRSSASTDSRVKTTVNKGVTTTVLERKGSWYLLRFPRGTEGWVRGDMLKQIADPVKSQPEPDNYEPPAPVDGDLAQSIVDLALAQSGIRYKWGGTSRGGFDCSGLLVYAFAKHGIKLPRTSLAMSTFGTYVSKSDLQKGDLIFYRTARSRRINHVAMFIGDGKFVHSSSYEHKVVVRDFASYKSPFAGARRVPGLQVVATEMEEAIAELDAEEEKNETTRVVVGADKIGK